MRRVAIISMLGISNSGGVERVAARHASLLGKTHEVRIVSLPDSGWWALARRRSRLVDRLFQVLFPMVSWAVARRWAGRDGLVISHGYASIGVGCDAVFAHGCWAHYIRSVLRIRRLRPGLIETYEALAARYARTVVSVSEDVAEQWTAHYRLARSKSRVVHNCVDAAVFAPADPEATVCDGPDLRVLFVGRLEVRKGLDWLDRLHQELLQQPSSISVRICSPTPPPPGAAARFPLFEIQSGLDAPALAAEYNRADLFLLPSQYEAFELSSIEALACGTPVLLQPTGARPTLHKLGCPAVYDLETAPSPIAGVRSAATRFRGLQRTTVATWAARHFDGAAIDTALGEVFAELERR
jgi:glycosyltransferase involved in cell wall biosynthesis